MNKKKGVVSLIILSLLFLTLCLPTAAYAASGSSDVSESYDKQIEGYKKDIEEIMDKVSDEDTKKKYEEIVNYLFDNSTKEKFMGDSAEYTIKAGYKTIEEAIGKAHSSMGWWERLTDNNITVLTNVWKSQFRREAEAFGIEYGNTFNNQGGTSEEIENASIKVNLLTWNRDKKNDGTSINTLEQGVIYKFLNSLESYSGFTGWVRAIAIALTITFGCATLMTLTMDRNASTEALQREFAKILFGVWFIMNYKFFALLIIRLGTLVTENVLITDFSSAKGKYVYLTLCQSFSEIVQASPNISGLGVLYAQGMGSYVGSGIGNAVSNFASSISNYVGGGLTQLASSLTVYAVAIEIGVRYLFTPIAIADLYSEKFRSNGWMYLKKLFAVSMQGAVIFMIIYCVDVLKNAIDTGSVITNTAINLTMIGMFVKSRQIANDIIGVH